MIARSKFSPLSIISDVDFSSKFSPLNIISDVDFSRNVLSEGQTLQMHFVVVVVVCLFVLLLLLSLLYCVVIVSSNVSSHITESKVVTSSRECCVCNCWYKSNLHNDKTIN